MLAILADNANTGGGFTVKLTTYSKNPCTLKCVYHKKKRTVSAVVCGSFKHR